MHAFSYTFQPVGSHPVPWAIGPDHIAGAWDHAGGPVSPVRVQLESGAFVGLNAEHRLRIEFGSKSQAIRITVVHFVEPPRVEAFNPGGVAVAAAASAAPPATPDTLELIAPAGEVIQAIEVTSPENEVLVLSYCRHE